MEEQSAVYDELSIQLFVSGYLAIMEAENQHMKPFMTHHLQKSIADTELDGHLAPSGYSSWKMEGSSGMIHVEAKLHFCNALVWHTPTSLTKSKGASTTCLKKTGKEAPTHNIAAKPGTKACTIFNQGGGF